MTSEKYRDCKAFQSHELFPLLKLLADSHDRIPGQDHPEVMHNEMESLLRLELGKYDDRTRIHTPKVKEGMDDITQAILDEMSNLLDNCRTLLDLHKQCHRRMQQQICHIQKDFLEQSSAIINSVKPLQQAPVYQPRGYDAMPGTVETGGSVLARRDQPPRSAYAAGSAAAQDSDCSVRPSTGSTAGVLTDADVHHETGSRECDTSRFNEQHLTNERLAWAFTPVRAAWSMVGKRSADSLENRPSQLQLHPRADNASSSNVLPAKRRICASHILDGRQRAEVTHDESADDTSVSRYEERSPPDGEQALISPGFDNEQGRMKPTFRHPPTVTSYLKEWFSKHKENPYPTAQEKEMLIAKSEKKFGFTMTNQQLDNWFINQRRRVPNGPNRSRLGSVGQSAAESVTVTAGTAVSSTSTMQIGNPQSQLSSHTRTPIQSPTMPNNTALSPVQLQMVMSQQHWDSGHGTSTLGPASILKSPTTLTGAPIIFTTTKPGVAKSSVAIAAPQQVLLLTPAPQPASTQPAVLSALSPPSLLPPVSGITVVSPPAIPMATSPLHMVSPSAGTYASTQNPMPEVKRVAYPQPIHHQGYQGATTLVYQVSDNNPNAKLNARHKPTA